MIKEFRNGTRYVAQGFDLAKKPGIRPYMMVPLIVNIIFFSVAGYLAIGGINDLSEYLRVEPDFGWQWVNTLIEATVDTFRWLLIVLAILFLLFFLGSIFTMMTHLLISPFIGLMGEKVEGELRETRFPDESIARIAGRTIKREFHKFRYWAIRALGWGLLALLLGFIPVIGAAGAIIWYVFGAWILAMQYIDVPADNNGVPFEEVLAMMRKHRSEVMGFGGVIMLLTATPIVNLFIIPVAVAGGVAFWVGRLENIDNPQHRA